MSTKTSDENVKALFDFKRSIRNNLSPNNRRIVMANVKVKYYWNDMEAEVTTQIMINIDNYPHSSLDIIEQDWLNSENFYTQFLTGYNHFDFDAGQQVLSIVNTKTSKIEGHRYRVEFREI